MTIPPPPFLLRLSAGIIHCKFKYTLQTEVHVKPVFGNFENVAVMQRATLWRYIMRVTSVTLYSVKIALGLIFFRLIWPCRNRKIMGPSKCKGVYKTFLLLYILVRKVTTRAWLGIGWGRSQYLTTSRPHQKSITDLINDNFTTIFTIFFISSRNQNIWIITICPQAKSWYRNGYKMSSSSSSSFSSSALFAFYFTLTITLLC